MRFWLLGALLLGACANDCQSFEAVDCADEHTLLRHTRDGDRHEGCRPDAWCEAVDHFPGAECVSWPNAKTFVADFSVEPDDRDPQAILVHVQTGGFPREFADDIRFTFGDGRAGHGEELRHRFLKPGMYAVDLEVLLADGRVLRASRPVTIGDASAAPAAFLTADAIPAELNGSRPFRSNAFTPADPTDDYDERITLALPAKGFTIDVTLFGAVRETLSLTADQAIGTFAAGENFAGRLKFEADSTMRVSRGSWLVDLPFPDTEVTLTLTATREDGRVESQQLTVRTVPFGPEVDPFDRKLTWLLRFDMDLFTIRATPGAAGTVALDATPGANGRADFVEELAAIGAQGSEAQLVGANATYLGWVKLAVVQEIRRVFLMTPDGAAREGIDLEIVADGFAHAPDPLLFKENGDFSVLRFGGVLDQAFGRSHLSYYDAERSDDSDVDLGIASTSLIGVISGTASVADVFAPLIASPVGDDPRDREVLSPRFDRWDPLVKPEVAERHDALRAAAKAIALVLAPVAAHEMGHAMGLMPPDRPPYGFFANRQDASVVLAVGTDDAHVNFPGLNVMQAGGSPLGLVGELNATTDLPDGLDLPGLLKIVSYELRLAPYERAYLQRRLTYVR